MAGVGDRIFFVLAYRVSVACVRRHHKFEFDPTLLSLIAVMIQTSLLFICKSCCSYTNKFAFSYEKHWGLYQSKVKFSLAFSQRPDHQVHNCKIGYKSLDNKVCIAFRTVLRRVDVPRFNTNNMKTLTVFREAILTNALSTDLARNCTLSS